METQSILDVCIQIRYVIMQFLSVDSVREASADLYFSINVSYCICQLGTLYKCMPNVMWLASDLRGPLLGLYELVSACERRGSSGDHRPPRAIRCTYIVHVTTAPEKYGLQEIFYIFFSRLFIYQTIVYFNNNDIRIWRKERPLYTVIALLVGGGRCLLYIYIYI